MVITADWTDVDPDLLADHARLHDALAALATLSARLAAPGAGRDDLIRLACAGVRRILDADTCRFAEHDGALVVDPAR